MTTTNEPLFSGQQLIAPEGLRFSDSATARPAEDSEFGFVKDVVVRAVRFVDGRRALQQLCTVCEAALPLEVCPAEYFRRKSDAVKVAACV